MRLEAGARLMPAVSEDRNSKTLSLRIVCCFSAHANENSDGPL